MKSKGVSGTSGTLAQEVVNGYAEKRGLAMPIDINMLPTPLTRDYKGGTTAIRKDTGKIRTDALDSCVKYMAEIGMLPTPTTATFKQSGLSEDALEKTIEDGRQETIAIGAYKMAKATGVAGDGSFFRLNPLFTEEMMGFPLMWTALPFLSESGAPKPSKPTATPSSPK